MPMEKLWIKAKPPSEADFEKLALSLNLDKSLAYILASRGIVDFQQAKTFFRPSLNELHDPFLMKDMSEAVNRLCEAVYRKEKILVYGDYDVDGTTSVGMVHSFLGEFVEGVGFYIPDRYAEGYGISEKGIHFAKENDYTLIIALDCGIRATKQATLASSLGLDLIICDHHLPGDELPDAHSILDPKQEGCNYPYKELSGCGVGFKLLQGFCYQNTIDINRLYNYLDFVVVSIASDIVPITGENRVLAHYGLKKLNVRPSAGLKSLIEISGLKRPVRISDIVFSIGPRINAAGRLRHARESVNLLISDDLQELESYAELLNQTNIDRRSFDQSITEEAIQMIEANEDMRLAKSTVLFDKNWHKGVVGIVASRCIERYYRPTIILTESEGQATGSARSVNGFDVHEAIASCEELLDQYGGHTHAAGLTLPVEHVEEFRLRFEQYVSDHITKEQLTPKISIDLEADFNFVSFKSYNIMKQMAPFGPGNLQPVISTHRVVLKNDPVLIKDSHVKMNVTQEGNGISFDAIAFGFGHMFDEIKASRQLSLAYHIDENTFQGYKCLQLVVKDIKIDH